MERGTRITEQVHAALVEQDLYWILLPREHSGEDADVATCIEVIEEIAKADGATGWSYFAILVDKKWGPVFVNKLHENKF